MGFRLFDYIGMIPAEVNNGKLFVDDNLIPPIQLPVQCNTIVMNKQCIYVSNFNIRCYLRNDVYEMVIWRDGSMAVFTRDTQFFVMGFDKGTIVLPTLNSIASRLSYGGLLCDYKGLNVGQGGQAYLIKSDSGKYYLVTAGCSLVVKGISENQFYMYYRKSIMINTSPYICLDGKRLECNAYGKIFEIEYEELINPRVNYKLGGVL